MSSKGGCGGGLMGGEGKAWPGGEAAEAGLPVVVVICGHPLRGPVCALPLPMLRTLSLTLITTHSPHSGPYESHL